MKFKKLFNENWTFFFLLFGLIECSQENVISKGYQVYENFSETFMKHEENIKKEYLKFPDNFLIGSATSAYQSEGAVKEDGRGLDFLELYIYSKKHLIEGGTNNDIASDSYHKYKEDTKLIKNIGFDLYRFSISWSRILPTGDENNINEAGIQHYKNVIDDLLANNITPVVTLNHFDTPQELIHMGGWLNPLMGEYFEKYVRIVFKRLGDKVKFWITLNEPYRVMNVYGHNTYKEGFANFTTGDYLSVHNMLRGHAKAYHVYDREFRTSQKGKIGIALDAIFGIPETLSEADKDAAERFMQFHLGYFSHPIFSEKGDYPPIMREIVDRNSKMEGRDSSRLPKFTKSEINDLKGSCDFLGINHYSSTLVKFGSTGLKSTWVNDMGVIGSYDPKWPNTSTDWMKVVPFGFRAILNWIKKEYNNPLVIVTENGYSDTGEIDDYKRIQYFQDYLQELLKAIHEDNCNVMGYTIWSLIDVYEMFGGYKTRFGLYHVDFDDKNRTRTEKKSVKYFKEMLKTRSIPEKFTRV